MPKPAIEPVYLPHNEPYLGQPHLLAFDQAIPDAMRANLEVARRTFVNPLSPLQIAATEIVPQGISLALSIRELIRQAYLYSAAILIRPLIERTGTIYYLQAHLDAVEAWRSGWPRRSQPSFDALLTVLHPGAATDTQDAFRTMLHKLVHSDPAGSVYNMFERADGVPVFSCGKIIDQPHVCNVVSIAGRHYLERLIAIAAEAVTRNKDFQTSISRRKRRKAPPTHRVRPDESDACDSRRCRGGLGVEIEDLLLRQS